MDDASVSQTLGGEVAANDKRWPLVLVVVMFLAGVAPVFLRRPTPPPRPATSGTSCTTTLAAPTNSSTHADAPRPVVNANGSC